MEFVINNIPQRNKRKFYHLNSANRTIIGNKMSEFIQEKIIEISLIDQTENSLVFKYNLKAQKMEGSAIIHQWSSDMDNLQADLILVTDLEGNFIDINQFDTLQKKWKEDFLPKLKVKYADFQPGLDVMIQETTKLLQNKELFIKNFIGYSCWRFFFQSWYKKFSAEEEIPLLLTGYFGNIDLPLMLSTSTTVDNNNIFIERSARLDNENFDRKSFARMLKDLTNVYNIEASLDIDMEERYTINNDGWLSEGELFLETSVNNWYSVSNAHQLKELSENEYHSFIKELS